MAKFRLSVVEFINQYNKTRGLMASKTRAKMLEWRGQEVSGLLSTVPYKVRIFKNVGCKRTWLEERNRIHNFCLNESQCVWIRNSFRWTWTRDESFFLKYKPIWYSLPWLKILKKILIFYLFIQIFIFCIFNDISTLVSKKILFKYVKHWNELEQKLINVVEKQTY